MAAEPAENRIGLVLEGGAMRGMYTAGVLDTFMTEGIRADLIVGVSAGALFGVNYLSGQRGRAIRYNKRFNPDPHYLGLLPLLREGNIVSTEYAYVRVPRQLDPFDDAAFQASASRFYAVITSMDTGEAGYVPLHSVFDQMDVLRASGSMPLVSRPVIINGKPYLDGAVADSIPFDWMLKQGVQKTIVILTRNAGYRKKAIPAPLANLYHHRYPHFARKLAQRHELYNGQTAQLKELEAAGKVFVFRPSQPINISHTERDPSKLQAVYDLGQQDARQQLAALKKYLVL